MPIFDETRRTEHGARRDTEGTFEYLSRSARTEADRVRDLIEDWASRLPCQIQDEWRARFRAPRTGSTEAAFFELVLHEWLVRKGFELVPHPNVPGSDNRPEFLAQRGQTAFYLEARDTTGEGPDDARSNAFRGNIMDALVQIPSPDFFVSIDFEPEPTLQPRASVFRRQVIEWIAGLDHDLVSAHWRENNHSRPWILRVECGGATVLLEPIPKGNARGEPEILGVIGGQAQWIDTQRILMRALRRKASKYGTLDRPYIIAVNDRSMFARHNDTLDTVFGSEVFRVRDTGEVRLDREGNGFFGTHAAPRHTRVSGVLSFAQVLPWHFAKVQPFYVQHPWARNPIAAPFEGCAGTYQYENEWAHREAGVRLADVFGLSLDWPSDGANTAWPSHDGVSEVVPRPR